MNKKILMFPFSLTFWHIRPTYLIELEWPHCLHTFRILIQNSRIFAAAAHRRSRCHPCSCPRTPRAGSSSTAACATPCSLALSHRQARAACWERRLARRRLGWTWRTARGGECARILNKNSESVETVGPFQLN
jgi:hypothetical protein